MSSGTPVCWPFDLARLVHQNAVIPSSRLGVALLGSVTAVDADCRGRRSCRHQVDRSVAVSVAIVGIPDFLMSPCSPESCISIASASLRLVPRVAILLHAGFPGKRHLSDFT